MTVSRRLFLASAAATALFCGAHLAAARTRGAATDGTFLGNPNATISSVSGSIALSRNSGEAPAFVQVSASGFSASGTRAYGTGTQSANAYQDVEWSWDFGDPTGTETFTRPTDGATVNANSDQKGPEALYCYRTAGPKTITCRGRYWNGTTYVTQVFTATYTATDFASTAGGSTPLVEYWVDSVNGLDTNNGLQQINDGLGHGPKKTLSFLQDASGVIPIAGYPGTAAASGWMRINLKRGSSWSGTFGIKLPNNNHSGGPACNFRMQAYGTSTDPKPIIEVTGASPAFSTGTGGTVKLKNNIVLSNINFKQTDAATCGNVVVFDKGGTSTTFSDVYADNCDCYSAANVSGLQNVIWFNGGDATSTYTRSAWYGGSITRDIINFLTITNATNNGSGLIRITVSAAHQLREGQKIVIASVGGVTAANGTWNAVNVSSSSTTFDLSGSTFSGTYTSGGTVNNTGGNKDLMDSGVESWCSWFGISLSGSGSNAALHHYIYPNVNTHGLFRWLNAGATGTAGTISQFSYFINLTPQTAAPQYFNISENNVANCKNFHDGADTNNRPQTTVLYDVVTERNAVHDISNGSSASTGVYGAGLIDITIRDNRYWNAPSFIRLYQQTWGGFILNMYRNKFYMPSTAPAPLVSLGGDSNYTPILAIADPSTVSFGGTPNITVTSGEYFLVGSRVQFTAGTLPPEFSLNTDYYILTASGTTITLGASSVGPTITYTGTASGVTMLAKPTKPLTVTDNVIQDDRAVPAVWRTVWTDFAKTNSFFDRNGYYAASSANIIYDNTTGKSLTTWKAQGSNYDANGTYTAGSVSGWTIPVTQWSHMG